MNEFTHIDLFSGIGGFSLAAESCGFRTILFCEIDEFCQKVLKKHWPETPIIPDIRDIDGTRWRGTTLLSGGFPCQPFSQAGKRKGKKDNRYLWSEMFRVIKEVQPRWIVAENVTGIIRMELGQVLSDLETIGYNFPRDIEEFPIIPIIPACGINAPHKRYRVWIMAYNDNISNRLSKPGDNRQFNNFRGRKTVGDVSSDILSSEQNKQWKRIDTRDWRGFNGISDRVDRLKSLGNAIVPQVAKEIIKCIYEIEKTLDT